MRQIAQPGEVVLADAPFRPAGNLELEDIVRGAQLLARGAQQEAARMRHRGGDNAADAVRAQGGGGVGGHRAPVVPHHHGVLGAEMLGQGDHVPAQGQGGIVAVLGNGAGRVAAHERRHGAETGRRQPAQQAGHAPGGVRKAVQAQHQGARAGRTVRRPIDLEIGEFHAVGADVAGLLVGGHHDLGAGFL